MRAQYFNSRKYYPISVEKLWEFFAHPVNLGLITPQIFNIELSGYSQNDILDHQKNLEIEFRILGPIGFTWESQFINILPFSEFTDIQTKGPFKLWKHRHVFEKKGIGCEMKDHISFVIHLGPVGNILMSWYIRLQLKKTFDYREKRIVEIFNLLNAKIE